MGNKEYVLTQDTEGMFSKIGRNRRGINEFNVMTGQYFKSLLNTLSSNLSRGITGYEEEEINGKLESRLSTLLNEDAGRACVCLDRFLLKTVQEDVDLGARFYRFNICRTVDGVKVPRQGADSFEAQIKEMQGQFKSQKINKLIVVDDGLFSGGTVKDFLGLLQANAIGLEVEKIIAFMSDSRTPQAKDMPPVEIINPVESLYEWVDIRDFTPMAGKRLDFSRTNKVTSSIPYIFPWSDGESASLNLSPNLFSISMEMLLSFQKLIKEYERTTNGIPLTFRELTKMGFPLPTNRSKTIPVSINDSVSDYLDGCIRILKKEQARKVIVFDMDGTLYRLDGENFGFRGSKLQQTVLQRAKEFVLKKENCTEEEAIRIVELGQQDPIGISQYFVDRYGISRDDYFNTVWNIDPNGIAFDFEIPAGVIKELKKRDPEKKLILLTSAPQAWAKRLLEYIGLNGFFESVYTGDLFGIKDEIFQILAGRYKPENITSVGDQEATDIKPAQKLKMQAFLASRPSDLQKLLAL